MNIESAIHDAIRAVEEQGEPKGSRLRGPKLLPQPRRPKSRRDASRARRKARRGR